MDKAKAQRCPPTCLEWRNRGLLPRSRPLHGRRAVRSGRHARCQQRPSERREHERHRRSARHRHVSVHPSWRRGRRVGYGQRRAERGKRVCDHRRGHGPMVPVRPVRQRRHDPGRLVRGTGHAASQPVRHQARHLHQPGRDHRPEQQPVPAAAEHGQRRRGECRRRRVERWERRHPFAEQLQRLQRRRHRKRQHDQQRHPDRHRRRRAYHASADFEGSYGGTGLLSVRGAAASGASAEIAGPAAAFSMSPAASSGSTPPPSTASSTSSTATPRW